MTGFLKPLSDIKTKQTFAHGSIFLSHVLLQPEFSTISFPRVDLLVPGTDVNERLIFFSIGLPGTYSQILHLLLISSASNIILVSGVSTHTHYHRNPHYQMLIFVSYGSSVSPFPRLFGILLEEKEEIVLTA